MTTPVYKDLETKLILRWVDTEDVMATQRALIEVTPEAAYLELPRGLRGEKGEKGDPGPQMYMRKLITSRAQLPNNLTEVDAGAAYPDTNSKSLWVWTGTNFFEIPNFIGLRGEKGITPRIQIGAVKPGGTASVSVNQAASTEETVVLDFVLPQGPRGPQGEQGEVGQASNVSASPDVDVTRAPRPGEALTWNGAKWAPRSIMAPIGPWIMGPNNFTPHQQGLLGSGDMNRKLVGAMTVPGLPFDWKPLVIGGLLTVETPLGVAFNAEVRVGNAQRGDVVGHGVGKPFQRREEPTLLYPWAPEQVTPSNSYGVVKANTATTIYVVLHKAQGSIGGWEFFRDHASLAFIAQPVNSAY